MRLLSLDVGTTQSGYCVIDSDTYVPLEGGKIDNEDLLSIVKAKDYEELVYEEFASYGVSVGESTIKSITWNGRYIQSALDLEIPVYYIYRREEKMNLCKTMRSKDKDIRQALIKRFAKFDMKNGKGTKQKKDWFYGFKTDQWSAYAVGITHLDKRKNGEANEFCSRNLRLMQAASTTDV